MGWWFLFWIFGSKRDFSKINNEEDKKEQKNANRKKTKNFIYNEIRTPNFRASTFKLSKILDKYFQKPLTNSSFYSHKNLSQKRTSFPSLANSKTAQALIEHYFPFLFSSLARLYDLEIERERESSKMNCLFISRSFYGLINSIALSH
jgi:hypothetical protein